MRQSSSHRNCYVPALWIFCMLLLLGKPLEIYADNGGWAITKLPMQHAEFPSINNSNEIVWSWSGIFSSTRGTLASSGVFPHIANCGEVVYADMFEGPYWDLVSTTRGRLTHGGIIDVNSTGFDIQSSGEVVYAVRDTNGYMQVVSTVQGQITSGPSDHYSPCINDNGEIVWSELIYGVGVVVVSSSRGTLPTLPGMAGVGGPIIWKLNNHGDYCYSGNLEISPGNTSFPHFFSSVHGVLIDDPNQYQWGGSLNDAGILLLTKPPYVYRAEWVASPLLSIIQDSSGLALEWPTNSTAFHVQYTTNSVSPLTWQAWTGVISTNGTNFHQTINPNLGNTAFFRLSTSLP